MHRIITQQSIFPADGHRMFDMAQLGERAGNLASGVSRSLGTLGSA